MLKNSNVQIKIVSSNKSYWENKLESVLPIGTNIDVDYNLLPQKSSMYLDCVCDNCSRSFQQRRYRDFSICGYCKTSTRMKGNVLGVKNRLYSTPSCEEIDEIIRDGAGKQTIAKKYSVSIVVVNRWLKELNIELPKYQGRKYFKSKDEYESALHKIRKFFDTDKIISMTDIVQSTGIPRHILINILQNEREFSSRKLKTKFEIFEDAYNNIIDNFDYYQKENATKTLKHISEENVISVEQLKRAFRENCVNPKIHSYNKSKGEIECRDYIRDLGENCDSYMFDKKYEIDCFVHDKMFGVEYCGEYWHKFEPLKDNKHYHSEKQKYFKDKNIQLMTIFESEWKDDNKREILKSMISSRIKHSSIIKISARECTIEEITKNDASEFHERNHISGSTISSYNFGLFQKQKLISVLSIVKSRFDKTYQYEISRFSNERYHSVRGGFSRLFKYFVKNYNVDSCITYSDLRFGEGEVYSKNGFEYVGKTTPNYYYYDKDVGKLESRMKYQKSKLKKRGIKEYSDSKTEYQIMMEMGYYKIYDCGNKRYAWIRDKCP